MSPATTWLQRRTRGRPATGTPIHIRIPANVLERIDIWAEEQGATRAAAIRHILKIWADTVGTVEGDPDGWWMPVMIERAPSEW